MIFAAFAFGTWLGTRRAEKQGINPSIVLDLTVWILISALIGSRIAYILFHLDEFKGRWLDAISPFQSDGTIGIAGLVVLGGVVFAVPTLLYFTKKRDIPPMKMADIMMPSLAFGLAIGRIGCLLNGCCYGIPTDQPWGIVFPSTCLAGTVYPETHLHPTQIYEIFYNSLIGVVLLLRTPHKKFEGELFYLYLVIYGLIRFFLEPLRHYRESMKLFSIGGFDVTVTMTITLSMVAAGIYLLYRGFSKVKTRNA